MSTPGSREKAGAAGADWVALDLAEGPGAALHIWVLDARGAVACEGRLPPSGNGQSREVGPGQLMRWLQECGVAGAASVPIVASGLNAAGQWGSDMSKPRAVPCPPLPERLELVSVGAEDNGLQLYPVPGLMQARPADLIRGGGTRIAGWLAQAPEFDGVVLCVSGCRSVWVHVSAQEIVSFQSFLTGELFAALLTGGPLEAEADLPLDADFGAHLAEVQARPERLAALLAALRTERESGAIGAEGASSRLAAALIGAELAAARPYWLGRDVALIAQGPLGAAYGAALEAQGIVPARLDDRTAALAGLAVARGRLRGG